MPKLSKFRVVNLIYNDTRHIYDEIFDFSNGSNGLMLLANGGGKTVLTQMMLQPVIPKTDLKTRKFADYFKNNHRPTLLMNEWLLDSDGGKLLTGLVIQNQVRRKRGQDDDQDVLNITAFVIEYHRAETYNIDNIPVIQRDAQGHRLMRSYDEITADLDKHARKHKGMVSVFNWSDSAEAKRMYQQTLGIYGIIQQEWLDTILKINKEEAGLQSFFNDAKKSETLIQKKILPIIESKLEENNTEKVEIQSLIKSHAQLLVKNDQIIKDEMTYNRFIAESLLYEKDLLELKTSIEALDLAIFQMSRVYYGYKDLSVQLEDEIHQLDEYKKLNRHEQQQIAFEEACFEFYKKWDEKDKLNKEAKQIELDKTDVVYKIQNVKNLKDTQEASKLYKDILQLKEKVSIKQEMLSNMLNEEDVFELDALMAVLLDKYGVEKDRLKAFGTELIEKTKEIEDQAKALDAKVQQLSQEIQSTRDEETKYVTLINHFEEDVNHLNETNTAFKWEKHPLLNEFDRTQLEAYIENIQDKRQKLQDSMETLVVQIETYDNETVENEKILSEEKVALKDFQNEEVNQSRELKKFREKYHFTQQSLEQYGIKSEMFYQIDEVNSLLSNMVEEREGKRHHLILEKAIVTQRMESLKAGQLNALSDDFASFLDTNDIRYEFGYNWLLNYKGDRIPEHLYLQDLAVLPYSLIMDVNDLHRFKEIVKSYHLTMVVPILTHEYIHTILKGESSLGDEVGLYYHTSFDQKLMDVSYREKEIERYKGEIDKIEQDIMLIQKGIEKIRHVDYGYLEFTKVYDSDTEMRLTRQYESVLSDIEQCQEAISHREQFIETTKEKTTFKRKTLEQNKEECHSVTILINRYLELKEEYLTVLTYIEKKNEVHLQTEQNERKLNQLHTEQELQRSNSSENLQKTTANDKALENIELEMIKYGGAIRAGSAQNIIGHPFTLETIQALEAKYAAYHQSHGQVKDIQNLIDEWQKQISEKNGELDKLQVIESDYMAILYDGVKHKLLMDQLQKLEEELKKHETELLRRWAVIETKEKDLTQSGEAILNKYDEVALVSRESIIHIDFKVRKNENQQQYKAFDTQISKYKSLREEVSASLNSFEDSGGDELRENEADVFSIEMTEVEIKDLRKEILQSVKQLRSKLEENKRVLTDSYNKLDIEFNRDNRLLISLFQNLFKGQKIYDYDYSKRVLEQARNSISVMLKKHETDLKNVKESEEKLNDFVLERVTTVYEQLREIDKHSTIEIQDKYQKMLYIEMPKKDTLDTVRLKNYLKSVINYSKHRMEENEVSDIDKYLDNHLSLDKLFDEYLPIRSISVSISKIEQNKVSKIPWEEVGKVSGGEEFVSVFILFISLMSYTRGYQLSRKQSGKVLVMDNPFGPVSSEHLLEPLFKIAKTYDAQLICFTHINTSAITSQFDLIYSLRVVREVGSSKEHVDVKLTKDICSGIEYVESGLFETGEVEQLGWL